MKREFIRTKTFERSWSAAGLGDKELRELETILLENPHAGVVVPHLNGGRKLRLAIDGRGKSGGLRIIYVDILVREQIYLLLAYPKNVATNLTGEQQKIISDLINRLKEEQ